MMGRSVNEKKPLEILGIPGTLVRNTFGSRCQETGVWDIQHWVSDPVKHDFEGLGERNIQVKIRLDDSCKNGANSFAITGAIGRGRYPDEQQNPDCLGCIHDEIAEVFPQLRKLIDYHLFDTNGPMHYLSNTLYLAGDKDCWGLREGEPRTYKHSLSVDGEKLVGLKRKFTSHLRKTLEEKGAEALKGLKVIEVPYEKENDTGFDFKPKFTVSGFECEWYESPFDTRHEAQSYIDKLDQASRIEEVSEPDLLGEGKKRELDAARKAACWPTATDETLMLPTEELKALLEERLPKVMESFKEAIKSIGLSIDSRVELSHESSISPFSPE